MITVSCDQNYSVTGLSRHTDYLVTVAAKNLEGLGPEASIQLRTEDGGITSYMLETQLTHRLEELLFYNRAKINICENLPTHIYISQKPS